MFIGINLISFWWPIGRNGRSDRHSKEEKDKRFYDLFKDLMFLLAPFLDGRFRLRWISCSSLSDSAQEELSKKIQQLVLEHCILSEHVNGPAATSPIDNTAYNH